MFNFNITHKLQKFAPPFTLYLSVENAQNQVQNIFKRPLQSCVLCCRRYVSLILTEGNEIKVGAKCADLPANRQADCSLYIWLGVNLVICELKECDVV